MGLYGNRFKREYPLAINREQLPAAVTLLVGAVFGKWLAEKRFTGKRNEGMSRNNCALRRTDKMEMGRPGGSGKDGRFA